jgi:hypothetical protein
MRSETKQGKRKSHRVFSFSKTTDFEGIVAYAFSLYSYMITQRHLLRQDCACRDTDQQCADNLSLLHERSGCGA